MATPESSAAETLEQGRPPRQRSRRRRLVVTGLGVLALLAVAAGLVADHRVRRQESLQVASCVEAATSSVGYTNARVDAIASYVSPSLLSARSPALRGSLAAVVSRAVEPTVPDARRALRRCSAVRVLWLHHGLVAVRRDCLRLLRRDLAYLDEVTADGLRAFEERDLPAGRCR